jgi:predicted murein hydrolase (TIGR00659 family)
MQHLTDNLLFGIVLSLAAFEIGLWIFRKTRLAFFNPLLVSIFIVIAFLLSTGIDLEAYQQGGQFINMFLGPATVALAVPLYKRLDQLKRHALPILAGIFFGSAVSIISVVFFTMLFKLDQPVIMSLLPKSVTTPIGIELSRQMGGIVPVTVMAIVITGISGAVMGPSVIRMTRIRNKIAIGVALGTAAHAIGTTKALEMGETESAMSSLSIGLAGIITVLIAPWVYSIASAFFSLFM